MGGQLVDQNQQKGMMYNQGFTPKQEDFGQGAREFKGPVTLESGAVYEGEWFSGQRDG